MTTTLQNSIWPNDDGNLGNIKVQIPDGVNVKWPEGDALLGNCVYQNGKLVGFVDTKALTVNSSGSTTINYDYVNIELPFAEDAMTINRGPRSKYLFIKFNDKEVEEGETYDYVIIDFNTTDQETIDTVRTAKKVVDKTMYAEDGSVIGTWDTSKLEVAGIFTDSRTDDALFLDTNPMNGVSRGLILSEFNSDLSSLRLGPVMFAFCPALTSFSSNLSNLTDGTGMFAACPLTSFSSDLSSLDYGAAMFVECHNLTSFTSDLSSLTDGESMFYNCRLDGPSVKNILDTLNTDFSGKLALGIGCSSLQEDIELFAREAGYDSTTSFILAILDRDGEIEVQYTGRPTTTYSLRRPSEDTLPVFAKLKEEEKYANYTSMDGSKKYMLKWFHITNGSTEGYTQFNSLEEAVAYFNIKPIER